MRKLSLALYLSAITLCFCLLGCIFPQSFYAATDPMNTSLKAEYENKDTGYGSYMLDAAGLLSPSEEEDVLDLMEKITAYGNVAFVSIDNNTYSSSERYADEFLEKHFGYDSSIVFLVDMEERYLWIGCHGDISETITDNYAQVITDNIYSYASDEEYATCATKAFTQVNTVMEGRWIAKPMKYVTNALLAIALALFINYFLVMNLSRSHKPSNHQLLEGIFTKVNIGNTRVNFTHQTKRYSPQSSGSSGGGGRSGGGGGGSSSGGGHRF